MYTNFWNENNHDELYKLKLGYINKAKNELKTTHPENIPSSLISLFSNDLLQEPVISDKGRVYEKTEIEKWIKLHGTDEFRSPLTQDMLHPFPELNAIIEEYRNSLQKFISQKISLISLARNMAAQSPEKIPEVFICPISKKMILHPVISNLGVVYDENSFVDTTDETAVPFTEFTPYLNFFCWKLKHFQAVNQTDNNLSSTLFF